MKRKDCDNPASRLHRLTLKAHSGMPLLCPLLCAIVTAAPAVAATVRLRASAVVVADEIRLADVCDFAGFDPITEERAAATVLGASPKAGDSRTIHVQAVRAVLSRTEMNMAGVTLTGATRCLVSRPAEPRPLGSGSSERANRSVAEDVSGGDPASRFNRSAHSSSSRTLRDAVHDHFARMLERYRGRPDIVFDRTDAEVLSLSAETHAFTVRTRNEVPLGLVQVEVDVVAGGQDERTIPLVVKVSMLRDVLVAHRAINQGATLRAADIERMSLTFTRVDGRLGVVDADRIIGKRAKRFITPGSVIRMDQLENVPLVNRGQFVQLRSREGNIQIVTTGKAMQGGMLGEIITVRALDRGRLQFEATIVGAGVVEVGHASPRSAIIARAEGGRS